MRTYDEDTKRSNLQFKLESMPKYIRELFFDNATKTKILEALRNIKSIKDEDIITIAYIEPEITLNYCNDNKDCKEKMCPIITKCSFNYYECLDLLEFMNCIVDNNILKVEKDS